jgi:hypothetical protein
MVLAIGLDHPETDIDELVAAFERYMHAGGTPVSRAQLEASMAAKLVDATFLGDVLPLLRTGLGYDPREAWERVHDSIIVELPGLAWSGGWRSVCRAGGHLAGRRRKRRGALQALLLDNRFAC